MHDTAPAAAAAVWLARFSEALDRRGVAAVLALFTEDCYWRDLVAFSWNVKTFEGKAQIGDMLAATLETTAPSGWEITRVWVDGSGTVHTSFIFATMAGRGEGIFKLEGALCRTILTTLQALHGHEEGLGPTRPMGVRHGADRERET